MIKHNQKGFTALETILLVVVVGLLVGVGMYVYQARHTTTTTAAKQGAQKTATKPSDEFDMKEFGIKMTLPSGLEDLSYVVVPEERMTDASGKPAPIPAYIKLISSQLKGQPSTCTGYDGEIAAITKQAEAPASGPDGLTVPSNLQRHIGSSYFILSLPNGGPCFDQPKLKSTEESKRDLIQRAFQTLDAL